MEAFQSWSDVNRCTGDNTFTTLTADFHARIFIVIAYWKPLALELPLVSIAAPINVAMFWQRKGSYGLCGNEMRRGRNCCKNKWRTRYGNIRTGPVEIAGNVSDVIRHKMLQAKNDDACRLSCLTNWSWTQHKKMNHQTHSITADCLNSKDNYWW